MVIGEEIEMNRWKKVAIIVIAFVGVSILIDSAVALISGLSTSYDEKTDVTLSVIGASAKGGTVTLGRGTENKREEVLYGAE